MTKIQWTNETWNPIAGCSKVSAGCKNCYAIKDAQRLAGHPNPTIQAKYRGTVKDGNWTGRINAAADDVWTQPIRWTRPRMIFVNSMSDLFHEAVDPDWIVRAYAAMALSPHHTFQVLTKRADLMQRFCSAGDVSKAVFDKADEIACDLNLSEWHPSEAYLNCGVRNAPWPLPNVWLGVSCEDQETANERIPILLNIPAAVHWVSAEPLLGPLNLTEIDAWAGCDLNALNGRLTFSGTIVEKRRGLDWVVVGGESGPKARECDVDWILRILSDCRVSGVPCFVKQLGSNLSGWSGAWIALETGGSIHHPKGGDISEWPEELRVGEFPEFLDR
ncbi:MAG TPA: DUF5131 family protein [Aridibacter sp.]|nr:DUF5131 family protein [Aridibacter sp.]